MRLFGKIDGAINRYDRAEWLTLPFDLAFETPVETEPACASVGDALVTRTYTGDGLTTCAFIGDELVTRVFVGDELCHT